MGNIILIVNSLDDNNEDSFCNLLDADENNTDDIRFVRNEVPKKVTFETLSETLNEQNYDPVVPQESKIFKANVGKDKVLTWTTDKPNVSRKRNESNIIRNKPGLSQTRNQKFFRAGEVS